MTLTVADLRRAIAGLPDDARVVVVHDGVVGVAAAPNGAVAVVKGLGPARRAGRFSVAEGGLVGGLAATGMPAEAIAHLLDRPADSVKRRLR